MATTSRRSPYLWATWLTATLAGDASCQWAIWFRAHFKHEKLPSGFDLAAWKAEHGAMVDRRVAELVADGWQITIEDQNAFTLQGQQAALAGKPDIVAERGSEALVVDCKSGKRRDSDYWQVLIYLLALPLAQPKFKEKRLVGEVRYRDGSVLIQPEEFTPDVRARIIDAIARAGGSQPPAKVPSARECRFCDIGSQDCRERVERDAAVTAVTEF